MSFGGFLANAFLGAVQQGAASVAEKMKEEARLAREKELLQEQRDWQTKMFDKEQTAANSRLDKQAEIDQSSRSQDHSNRVGIANLEIQSRKDLTDKEIEARKELERIGHSNRMSQIGAQNANEMAMFDKKLGLLKVSGDLSERGKEQVKYLQEELKSTREAINNAPDEKRASQLTKYAEETQRRINGLLGFDAASNSSSNSSSPDVKSTKAEVSYSDSQLKEMISKAGVKSKEDRADFFNDLIGEGANKDTKERAKTLLDTGFSSEALAATEAAFKNVKHRKDMDEKYKQQKYRSMNH